MSERVCASSGCACIYVYSIYLWVCVCMCMPCLIFIIPMVNLNGIPVADVRRRGRCEPWTLLSTVWRFLARTLVRIAASGVFIKLSVYTTDLAPSYFLESRRFPILFIQRILLVRSKLLVYTKLYGKDVKRRYCAFSPRKRMFRVLFEMFYLSI